MKISIFAFTDEGYKLQVKIKGIVETLTFRAKGLTVLRCEKSSELIEQAFSDSDCLIFIGATGIATRLCAPFLKDKLTDPAIIVIDERAQFVIPLASGHVGGANGLSRLIADRLSAIAVITTATDVEGVFSVDDFAASNNLLINDRNGIRRVAKKLLSGETVSIAFSDDVIVSSSDEDQENSLLHLMMRPYVVGMGCRRDKDPGELEDFFLTTVEELGISISQILAIASIDVKKNERALVELSDKYNIPLVTYSAKELEEVQGEFEESDFVKEKVGVSDVSARAAKCCGGSGSFLLPKNKKDGMTISVFEKYRRINLKYE